MSSPRSDADGASAASESDELDARIAALEADWAAIYAGFEELEWLIEQLLETFGRPEIGDEDCQISEAAYAQLKGELYQAFRRCLPRAAVAQWVSNLDPVWVPSRHGWVSRQLRMY